MTRLRPAETEELRAVRGPYAHRFVGAVIGDNGINNTSFHELQDAFVTTRRYFFKKLEST